MYNICWNFPQLNTHTHTHLSTSSAWAVKGFQTNHLIPLQVLISIFLCFSYITHNAKRHPASRAAFNLSRKWDVGGWNYAAIASSLLKKSDVAELKSLNMYTQISFQIYSVWALTSRAESTCIAFWEVRIFTGLESEAVSGKWEKKHFDFKQILLLLLTLC